MLDSNCVQDEHSTAQHSIKVMLTNLALCGLLLPHQLEADEGFQQSAHGHRQLLWEWRLLGSFGVPQGPLELMPDEQGLAGPALAAQGHPLAEL